MRVQLQVTWRYNGNVSEVVTSVALEGIQCGVQMLKMCHCVRWRLGCNVVQYFLCSLVLLSIFLNNATFTTMYCIMHAQLLSPMSLNIHFTPLPLSLWLFNHDFHTLLITCYYMSG